jgi:hypothetical protein
MRSRAGRCGPFEVRGVRRRKQSSGTERFPRRPRCLPPAIRWSRDRRVAGRKAVSQARARPGRRADGFSFGKNIDPAKAGTPVRGRCCPGLAVGLLRKRRHPARGSGSVPKGRRISLRGSRLPGEAAKSVRGWRCLDPAPRLPRRRGARVKGPGRRQRPVVRKGSALQGARGCPPQGTGSPGTSPCSSGPMPGTLSVPGASGGVPPGHLNAGFPSQRPDAPFFYHLAGGGATSLCGTLCSAPTYTPIYSSHPRHIVVTRAAS